MGTTTTNAPATEVTKVEELGPRAKYRAQPIVLVATSNPKKKPSMSYDRFEGYFKIDWAKPQTVGSVIDAGIVRMDDIRNDHDKGYIVVGAENIKAHEKAAAEAHAKAVEDAKKLLASVGK